MFRFRQVLWLLLALGCQKTETNDRQSSTVPSGQGHFIADDGRAYTLFTTQGQLGAGTQVAVEVQSERLDGYVFNASGGETFYIQASPVADVKQSVALAVYGPRRSNGLWGQHIAQENGRGSISLSFEIPATGRYFILLQRHKSS